jgi:hypothetical protein
MQLVAEATSVESTSMLVVAQLSRSKQFSCNVGRRAQQYGRVRLKPDGTL